MMAGDAPPSDQKGGLVWLRKTRFSLFKKIGVTATMVGDVGQSASLFSESHEHG